MGYIEPNFKIDNDSSNYIITPQLNDDGETVDEIMVVENLSTGKVPFSTSVKVDRNKVHLAQIDAARSLWLLNDGSIKIQ